MAGVIEQGDAQRPEGQNILERAREAQEAFTRFRFGRSSFALPRCFSICALTPVGRLFLLQPRDTH